MNNDIADLRARREEHIGDPLAYACMSWVKHLLSSSEGGNDTNVVVELVNSFFRNDFLSWLEVLSIEGDFLAAVYSLRDLRSWLTNAKNADAPLLGLIDDCNEFVHRFFRIMKISANHIYHSALPWCPTLSLIRTLYHAEFVTEVKTLNAVDRSWDAGIRMIPMHSYSWREIVFSHTGALVAVYGDDNIKIFDTMAGAPLAVIVIRNILGISCPVVFSPNDGLVSSCHGSAVCVWDVRTCNIVRTFEGHQNAITSVAFSPCGTMVASGSYDKTVRIWNISSGCCECVFEDHVDAVRAVCWTAIGNKVLSGSDDRNVRVWDVLERMCSKGFPVEIVTTAIASSPGSFAVVSGSVLRVFNSEDGCPMQTISTDDNNPAKYSIRGDSNRISSVRYSVQRDMIVYTNGHKRAVWDLAKRELASLITFCDYFLAFSPDGTYAASDSEASVQIWKIKHECSDYKAAVNGSEEVTDMSFSPDEQLVLSKSNAAVNIWDATIGVCLSTFDRHGVIVHSAVFSSNSAFVACLSSHYVMGAKHARVWSWTVHTPSSVKSFEVDLNARHIALFSDGRRLVIVSQSHVKVLDTTNRRLLASSEIDPPVQKDVRISFSIDETNIVIESDGSRKSWHICPTFIFYHDSSSSDNPSPSLPMVLVPLQEEQPRQGAPAQGQHIQSLVDKDEWILDQNGRRILWVPENRRASSCAVQGMKAAVGTKLGRFYMVDFSDTLSF